MTKWEVGPKYRGWLKLHCLVEIDTNEIIAGVLTEEQFGDSVVTELAFGAGHGIGEIYADAVRGIGGEVGLRTEMEDGMHVLGLQAGHQRVHRCDIAGRDGT